MKKIRISESQLKMINKKNQGKKLLQEQFNKLSGLNEQSVAWGRGDFLRDEDKKSVETTEQDTSQNPNEIINGFNDFPPFGHADDQNEQNNIDLNNFDKDNNEYGRFDTIKHILTHYNNEQSSRDHEDLMTTLVDIIKNITLSQKNSYTATDIVDFLIYINNDSPSSDDNHSEPSEGAYDRVV